MHRGDIFHRCKLAPTEAERAGTKLPCSCATYELHDEGEMYCFLDSARGHDSGERKALGVPEDPHVKSG